MARRETQGPRLASFVHVADAQGASHVFGPDDDVPTWAQRKIVNPKAWEGGELPKIRQAPKPKGEGGSPPATQDEEQPDGDESQGNGSDDGQEGAGAPESGSEDESAGETTEEADGGEQEPAGPPPRSGAGSGKPAWHAYAKAQGLDIAPDASRDEVIELLEDSGIDTGE